MGVKLGLTLKKKYKLKVRSEHFTAMNVKIAVFWDLTPHILIGYQYFKGSFCVYHQDSWRQQAPLKC
jgi:hypothetical protein